MKVVFILAPLVVAAVVFAHPPEKRGSNEHTKMDRQRGLEEKLTMEIEKTPHGHHDSKLTHSEHSSSKHSHKKQHKRETKSTLAGNSQNLRPMQFALSASTSGPSSPKVGKLPTPPLTTSKPQTNKSGVLSPPLTKSATDIRTEPKPTILRPTKESTTSPKRITANNNDKQSSLTSIPNLSKTSIPLKSPSEMPTTPLNLPAPKIVLPTRSPLNSNDAMLFSPITSQPKNTPLTGTQMRPKRSPLLFSKTTTTTHSPSSISSTITSTTSKSYTTETPKSSDPSNHTTLPNIITKTTPTTSTSKPIPSGSFRTTEHTTTLTTTPTSIPSSSRGTSTTLATSSKDVSQHTTDGNKPTTTRRSIAGKL